MRKGSYVAGYTAMGGEPDLARFLSALAASGHRLALPATAGRDDPLTFRAWQPGERLVRSPLGMMQPAETARVVTPDIVLVPLLAFDRRLNRLGQGAGHYDRALAAIPHALRIGVAWSVQEVDAVPVDPWDAPLDAIVTEREWIAGPPRRS